MGNKFSRKQQVVYPGTPIQATTPTGLRNTGGRGAGGGGGGGGRPRVPPPLPPKPNIPMYVALYEYKSTGDGDLNLQPGDLMIYVNDRQSNNDWAYVLHKGNGLEGYVPKNYIARQESLEKEFWYFGKIARADVEKMLNRVELPTGTFLIREQTHDPGELALSVKFPDAKTNNIRNYKIRKSKEDNKYCLSPQYFYPSLHELISDYQRDPKGLCCKLAQPCPKMAERLWDLSPMTQDNYEIPKADFTIIKSLGQGFFGEVYHARWKGKIDVAVKSLKNNSGMSREAFLMEAKIMKECRHDNLVSLFGVCTDQEPICILTEYMSNGNLLKYLQNGEGKSLHVNVLIDMSAQIAKGMAYLEQKRIVHRDLAARNVLVGDKLGSIPRVRVADFGLAKIFNEEYAAVYISQPGNKLPIKWTAPEALMYNTFSVKSDVWSFGVLLYEMFTRGCTPYPGMTSSQVVDRLRQGYRMPKPLEPTDFTQPLYEIMLKCWAEKPEQRDTFEFLYNFFDDYVVSAERSYFETAD